LDGLGGAAGSTAGAAGGTAGHPGTCGIGHTRWATHGAPTDRNAHPHRDCAGRLAVIHNGIIENFVPLRAELERRGHELASEPDTEAVAHLLEEELASGVSPPGADPAARPRRGRAGDPLAVHRPASDRVSPPP